MLHDLCAQIKAQQPSAVPVVAPLKGEARAAFKTLDKYGGDSSRLAGRRHGAEVALDQLELAFPAFVPALAHQRLPLRHERTERRRGGCVRCSAFAPATTTAASARRRAPRRWRAIAVKLMCWRNRSTQRLKDVAARSENNEIRIRLAGVCHA